MVMVGGKNWLIYVSYLMIKPFYDYLMKLTSYLIMNQVIFPNSQIGLCFKSLFVN